ncbi:MAG: 4-(cytidine 5'-diphospho)-2-C-methyl-D-erythritol kinase [Sulfitobacter sp.]
MIKTFAAAKVNLTLHVTGRRSDGYHLLDSLVAFAQHGDHLMAETAEGIELALTGPMAAGLPLGPDNLVVQAAALMGGNARITLDKHLPIASGIGGGSADAAAALRAIAALKGAELPADVLCLGADLPVCLLGRPARMRGIGEELHGLADFPEVAAVLVNPNLPVSTGKIFAAMARVDNPAMPDPVPHFADASALIDWLGQMRNDLQTPAEQICPAITNVIKALRGTMGMGLARMSGSGATCFGLYARKQDATAAAQALSAEHPGWWVQDTVLGSAPN